MPRKKKPVESPSINRHRRFELALDNWRQQVYLVSKAIDGLCRVELLRRQTRSALLRDDLSNLCCSNSVPITHEMVGFVAEAIRCGIVTKSEVIDVPEGAEWVTVVPAKSVGKQS